jgi:hypothetical protein
MTTAVFHHQAHQANNQAPHAEALTFDRQASRLVGITPAFVLSARIAHPGLVVGDALAAIECWLIGNPTPARLVELVAERLAIAARRQAKTNQRSKGRRLLAPLQPDQKVKPLVWSSHQAV